ncbi:hypothetical protein [Chryseobacterium lathyri]|uniref:hypothetical protein n=1 Tax=Chryseobacterium lathyri TaxID=395933 RepID=UPI0027D88AAF|nr:hypothetical protein [Chryseobacterium lathyri]
MVVTYNLNLDSDENFYCQISDENLEVSFDMKYKVDPKIWNYNGKKVSNSDPYFFTLKNFKEYLFSRYHDLRKLGKEEILSILKEESLQLLKNSGVEGVSKNIFNIYANEFGLNEYDKYIYAFERYTGLQQKDYRVEIIDYLLHFHTNEGIYEMNTYVGLVTFLKKIIRDKRYFDIEVLTEVDIWSEIYDENISKHEFFSKMSNELELCIKNNFEKAGRAYIVPNKNYEEIKKQMRIQFQKFRDRSKKNVNWIDLAWEINEGILFPLTVITMTDIFDLEVCCQEYCELNFYNENGDWQAICLDDNLSEDDDNESIFFIRIYK